MRQPAFWYRPTDHAGCGAWVLAPLGALYARATARRVATSPGYRAKIPVICVGNLNVGGTGKTPTVIALVQRLTDAGLQVHVVSRGYGGSLTGPVQVNERQHRAGQTGDEPLLLAAFAPTWISRDRGAGVRAAEAAGAEAILLDDGFQNPAVFKDLSIVVVDAARGFGNGRVLPAGPLRETVSAGLARADFVLSIGDDRTQGIFSDRWGGRVPCPRLTGRLHPLATGLDWQGMDVLAFAGIGDPQKFFETLGELGANLLRTQPLDDHQPLNEPLMKRLEGEAATLNAQLVTTEKDAVRLPDSFRAKVLTLPVRLHLQNCTALDAALAAIGLKISPTGS